MAYIEKPVKQEVSDIGGAVASGTVTRYTFVALNAAAGTLTTATSGAFNVGIATSSATAGNPCGVKFSGVTRLLVNGTTPISVGDTLAPTTGGKGIKAVSDRNKYNAVALEGASADNVYILVRVVHGERSTT
jgi:hypothetical protein